MSTVERFDDRADDYVRYRPTYPPEAIDAVLQGSDGCRGLTSLRGRPRPFVAFEDSDHGTHDPEELVAADVGAGTGISARLLANCGVHVYAVEPNAAMRDRAEPHDRVEWRDGTGEATGLPDASVDLVLCAQAYHWFDPEAACREFGRILRPGGRLALMWNDGDEATPVARAYYDAVRAVATDGTLSHKTVAAKPRVCAPFGEPRVLKFRHAQRLDADGLIGRAMSASYVPKEGEQAEWLRSRLREIHAEHAEDGVVSLWYDVWVYAVHAGE